MPQPTWVRRIVPEPPRLGNELIRLRDAVGLQQQEVAERTGISKSQLNRYELGANVSPDKIRLLADFYHDSYNRLYAIQQEHRAWRDTNDPLPGPALAIADEPGRYDVVTVLVELDDDGRLPDATRLLELFREGKITAETLARASSLAQFLRQGVRSHEELTAYVSSLLEDEQGREPSDSK